MDDINDNDNDHTTLTDGSDVIASSDEMPSGLVSVNTAPSSLGILTQAPQHVTDVTSFDVNTAKVRSSQHIAQGLRSPTSNSLQPFIGDGSKNSFKNNDTLFAKGTDANESVLRQNAGNHSSFSFLGERTASYSEDITQPICNESDYTTVTEQKIFNPHILADVSLCIVCGGKFQ